MSEMSPQDRLQRVLDRMKEGAASEMRHQIKNALPPTMSEFFQEGSQSYEPEDFDQSAPPSYYDTDEDTVTNPPHDDEPYYDTEEDSEGYSMSFENKDSAKENLQMAVAAWRMLSEYEDDVVAQNPHTGITFFGRPEDLQEFCDQRDFNYNNWQRYADASQLRKMDCDLEAFQQVMHDLEAEDETLGAAQKAYEGFHWGDKSSTTGYVDIPGLSPDARPYFLGVGREICYGAKKEGKFQEYYHIFGEESGTYPAVYGIGDDVVVIYGGGTHISPRGIID